MTPPKLISSVFLVLVFHCFISCSDKMETDGMTRPLESETEVKFPKESSSLNNIANTKVVIQSIQDYGENESFARESAALLEEVINSSEFKSAVMANNYEHDQGLTPKQIYEKIMLAHEIDGPGGEDYVIDLRLRTINLKQDGSKWMTRCAPNSSAGTIGIDGGGTGIAAVCPQWLNTIAKSNKTSWLAAHFMHEYMHILNFKHPNKKSASVPYKIHFIIEKLGAEKSIGTRDENTRKTNN